MARNKRLETKDIQGSTMTDEEFLMAMRIEIFPAEARDKVLLEALEIDDRRSNYCEQLEYRIARQTAEVEALRGLVQLLRGLLHLRAGSPHATSDNGRSYSGRRDDGNI
jgi:hypothetical protein